MYLVSLFLLQSNRIAKLEGLDAFLTELEELYISHNGYLQVIENLTNNVSSTFAKFFVFFETNSLLAVYWIPWMPDYF